MAIGREIAEFVIGAGHEAEAQPVERCAGRRRGAQMADRARLAAGDEAVPILPPRFEAAALDMHRMREIGIGLVRCRAARSAACFGSSATSQSTGTTVGRHAAGTLRIGRQRFGREPGPQHRRRPGSDSPRRRRARTDRCAACPTAAGCGWRSEPRPSRSAARGGTRCGGEIICRRLRASHGDYDILRAIFLRRRGVAALSSARQTAPGASAMSDAHRPTIAVTTHAIAAGHYLADDRRVRDPAGRRQRDRCRRRGRDRARHSADRSRRFRRRRADHDLPRREARSRDDRRARHLAARARPRVLHARARRQDPARRACASSCRRRPTPGSRR